MSDNQFTSEFELEKETKNTIKFAEKGNVPKIGTIYIQKHALQLNDGELAKNIRITVELLE